MIGLAASIGDLSSIASWIGVSLAIARQRQCGGSLLPAGSISAEASHYTTGWRQWDTGYQPCGPELTGEKWPYQKICAPHPLLSSRPSERSERRAGTHNHRSGERLRSMGPGSSRFALGRDDKQPFR